MKRIISAERKQPIIGLASEVVYMSKPYWCNATYKQLKLSLLKPRKYYDYDPDCLSPVLVFLCGGALEQMDCNVWQGELSWFAKRGWAVASVEYSTNPRTVWPTQLQEIKTAIRFLRAHADEFRLDAARICLAGESAGGFLALAAAMSGDQTAYRTKDYADHSDRVDRVMAWYPAVSSLRADVMIHLDLNGMPDLLDWVSPAVPPVLLLHGTEDQLVSCHESEMLHDALQSAGVPCDLYLLEGAHHNDAPFIQNSVKRIMLEFLEQTNMGEPL